MRISHIYIIIYLFIFIFIFIFIILFILISRTGQFSDVVDAKLNVDTAHDDDEYRKCFYYFIIWCGLSI